MSTANTEGKTTASTGPKIGLLPLYLKLYDDRLPQRRHRVEAFAAQIRAELEKRGLLVLSAPVCRVKAEFEAAMTQFERAGAEAIVTLHLAYSPSLESAEVLARTELPIIVCDTTPTWSYGPGQDPDELMYNHGIHGVQDMCNLLLRNGKPYHVEVGHWEKSDVLDRVAARARAAGAAHHLRHLTAGLIGDPFQGMGDFFVTTAELERTLGVKTRRLDGRRVGKLLEGVTEEDVHRERRLDEERFEFGELSEAAYRRSVRTGLALERWIQEEGIGAFSFNFLEVDRTSGLETVPFLQASKLLARGVGFGGEGDLLTASLVAALASMQPETTFTEMFCPDWENGNIYLSHMGEMNWRLVEGKPRLLEMDYAFSDTDNPVYLAGRFKPGEILLVDLLPLEPLVAGGYRLIVSPATMLPVSGTDRMEKSVRGWFKPSLPLEEFLACYSELGGTHHLALSYGLSEDAAVAFGEMMGWDVAVIG
jgi:L-arabinose isomerase